MRIATTTKYPRLIPIKEFVFINTPSMDAKPFISHTPENRPAFAVPAIDLKGDNASGTNWENTQDAATTIKQVGMIKYTIRSGLKKEKPNKVSVDTKATPIIIMIFLFDAILERWLYTLPKNQDTPNAIAK